MAGAWPAAPGCGHRAWARLHQSPSAGDRQGSQMPRLTRERGREMERKGGHGRGGRGGGGEEVKEEDVENFVECQIIFLITYLTYKVK